ncbi:MAG: hypothetical protein DCC67_02690 [Planctomycetota bacterium]|nr:MAG: hypothetical protein DCC67_02690 [Planctomycetota bacterium]
MTRTANIPTISLYFAVLAALPVIGAAEATAQVVAYHHRSTVFGDHAAGAAELVRAYGAFLRDEAAAAQQWVSVAAARDQLYYQRGEYHYRLKQLEQQYIQQKAARNRERQQLNAAAEEAAAERLLQSTQHGVPVWPAALQQPKFAGSMTLIESLLQNWSAEGAASPAYRRALATEAGVLRARVAADTTIDFNGRVEAVRTLKRLQLLAERIPDAVPSESRLAMQ